MNVIGTPLQSLEEGGTWLQDNGKDGQVLLVAYKGGRAILQRIVTGKIEVQLPLPFPHEGDDDETDS